MIMSRETRTETDHDADKHIQKAAYDMCDVRFCELLSASSHIQWAARIPPYLLADSSSNLAKTIYHLPPSFSVRDTPENQSMTY